MHPARRGACKGTSRGVLVLEGVNTPPRGVDKILVTGSVYHQGSITESGGSCHMVCIHLSRPILQKR